MKLQYFFPYIVQPTYLVERNQEYILLQRRLGRFDYLDSQNMYQVKDQVDDLFSRHQQLVRDGMYLEMIGLEGIKVGLRALFSPKVVPCITNLVIERTEQGSVLCLPDITITRLDKTYYSWKSLRDQTERVYNLARYYLEAWLIRHHFGLDFGKGVDNG